MPENDLEVELEMAELNSLDDEDESVTARTMRLMREEYQRPLLKWIEEERQCLWGEFVNASHRAIQPPDPRDANHWSMEMGWIAERIREATGLLGSPTDWENLSPGAFPWYEPIEGIPLPEEGWQWIRECAAEDMANGDIDARFSTAKWALQYAPKVVT